MRIDDVHPVNIDPRKDETSSSHVAKISSTLDDCRVGYLQCRTRREIDQDNENH